jgi:hypothetical protein
MLVVFGKHRASSEMYPKALTPQELRVYSASSVPGRLSTGPRDVTGFIRSQSDWMEENSGGYVVAIPTRENRVHKGHCFPSAYGWPY